MIDLANLLPGANAADFARFEAQGHVPFELFRREQEWREELQHVLDQVMITNGDPRQEWCTSAEAIERGRAAIRSMLDEKKRLAAELAEIRREHQRQATKLLQLAGEQGLGAPASAQELDLPRGAGRMKLDEWLRLCEETAIGQSLQIAEGNMTEAAGMLGIGRSTFYRKMRDFGID